MSKCPKCGWIWKDEDRTKGGKARWSGLTAKERSEAARKAVMTRYNKPAAAKKAREGKKGRNV